MNRVFRSAVLFSIALGLSATSYAQSLSWAAYDTSGNLVAANAGTGGSVSTADTVSFTVPTGQSLIFVTQNFTPIDLTLNNVIATVTYNMSAQGLGTGNGVNTRPLGVGLYNTGGTAGVTDDNGYFGLWNANGPYPELYTHTLGANLMSGAQQGQGTVNTAPLQDNVTYSSEIRLRSNGSGNIGLGNNSALFANAGIGWTDNGAVTNSAYINPTAPPGGFRTFDEFAIYLSNTSGGDETINLDSISLTPLNVVPEPSTFVLAGMGLLGLISFRRFRK